MWCRWTDVKPPDRLFPLCLVSTLLEARAYARLERTLSIGLRAAIVDLVICALRPRLMKYDYELAAHFGPWA